MTRIILAFAVVISLIAALISSVDAQSPETGSIVGRVKLKPRIGGAALASSAYPTRAVGPRESHPLPEIKNVVVYVKDAAFRGALTPRTAEIRQEHETFIPHVLAVTRGSTLDFP